MHAPSSKLKDTTLESKLDHMGTCIGIGRHIFLPGCLLEAESLTREVSRVGLGDLSC